MQQLAGQEGKQGRDQVKSAKQGLELNGQI